jgi:hypothetical protein
MRSFLFQWLVCVPLGCQQVYEAGEIAAYCPRCYRYYCSEEQLEFLT